MAQSVSARHLVLEIQNKSKIRCHLKRHLAPKTVGTVMRTIPLEGHVHFLGKSVVYFETAIDVGTERTRKEFRRGDVAFLASSGIMCFFRADVSGKAMTMLGRLEDASDLENAVSGDVLRLYEEV